MMPGMGQGGASQDRAGDAMTARPALAHPQNTASGLSSSLFNDLEDAALNGEGVRLHEHKGHCMASSPKNGDSRNDTTPDTGGLASGFTHQAPAGAAKKVSEVLGEIVWLMSQSPLHKQFFISDLEWLVMTPVLLQQFRLFYDKDKPIGVTFWATVNDEVEERLKAGTSRLRPQDWKSGDKLWVVEVIAPFGGAEEMVKDLKAKVFAERDLKYLALNAQGQRNVCTC